MSNSSQIKFLKALKAEIERVGSKSGNKAQRALFNKNATVFTITQVALERAIRESMNKGIPLPPKPEHYKAVEDLIRAVKGDTAIFIKTISTRFKNQDSSKAKVLDTSDASRLVVSVHPLGGDVFARIKGVYNIPLTTLFEAIKAKSSKALRSQRRGATFALEHDHFMGVLETTLRDTIEGVLKHPDPEDGGRAMRDVLTWLKSQEVDIQIIRDGPGETMSVFLGSSVVNDREAKDVQKKKKILLAVLEKALEKLQSNPAFSFIELKGSDSIINARRKKLIKTTLDPFKKQKNVKVTTENTKIKTSKTNKKNSFGPKNVKATGLKLATRVKRVKARKGVASAPLAEIMAKMNARITQEVRKNMQEPALVNRSGRFAESVRVTDVVQTPKGFPSIGYTYQRSPYQVFEEGSSGAWSNGQRDPRKLIDASIREIATKMAIGRFFTRRV